MAVVLLLTIGALLAWLVDVNFLQNKKTYKIEKYINADYRNINEHNQEISDHRYNNRNHRDCCDVEIYRHGGNGGKVLQLNRGRKVQRNRVER